MSVVIVVVKVVFHIPEDSVISQFKAAYTTAAAENDRNILNVLGTILIASGKSKTEFESFVGTNIAANHYKKLKFYAETLGCLPHSESSGL